ncbi:MAG: 3'(2'),5'-bisphosphate nucleotidase [Candidatus Latescibacteria bacterium]|nr:3'(2'),5'-bisphosphate nucleotidase [Candidatus Latescibacterota bacterium]
MAFERERDVAVAAVREAAQLCGVVRKELVESHALEKSDRSPVTVADFGSQALVCRLIESSFPDDPIVGEEDAATLRSPDQAEMLDHIVGYVNGFQTADADTVCEWIDAGNGEVSDRYWTLDPIDGTKGFLRGDQYAVALALVIEGDVKVAVVACPALLVDIDKPDGDVGVLLVAVRGEGTTIQPLAADSATECAHVAHADDERAWRFVESVESGHSDHGRQEAIAKAVGITTDSLRMDSQAKYCAVSRGDAALYLRLPSPGQPDYREKIWDHAAGSLVVEEAGGRVTDMHGNPLDFAAGALMVNNRGVVVSSGEIHDLVIAALKKNG